MVKYTSGIVLWLVAAALGAGCVPLIDYDGTTYQCPDGITCPDGFTCIDLVCRDRPPDPPDAGEDVDAPPVVNVPDAGIGGPMVDVPAGTFFRGCDFFAGNNCPLDTFATTNQITLSAFAIDQHEVTQADYQLCVAAGSCDAPSDGYDPVQLANFPVVYVEWSDAVDFCTFARKRLPTEAEWEKAARGTEGPTYPWGEAAPTCLLANFSGCGGQATAVGIHTGDASPYGATEMAGNVFEWVADYYDSNYYTNSPATDPPGPTSGGDRVVRGGSFESNATALRTFEREHESASKTDKAIGFRCAK
jgi:formylglycine-generating enzyme required for sulfatase activity